jgi:hypothetical protein
MRRSSPRSLRPFFLFALLAAALLLGAALSHRLRLPALPRGTPCPPGAVHVRNARFLTRGNVGHWGYALFGLHQRLLASQRHAQLSLLFDARVASGDWVRTATAALARRHGTQLSLLPHRPGRCPAALSVDANDAVPLSAGREPALRQAWLEVCHVQVQPSVAARPSLFAPSSAAQPALRTC